MLTLPSVVVVYNQLLTEYCEPVCLFQFDSNIYPPNRQLSFDMILGTRVVDVSEAVTDNQQLGGNQEEIG